MYAVSGCGQIIYSKPGYQQNNKSQRKRPQRPKVFLWVFIAYMNVLNDLRLRAHAVPETKRTAWESISHKTRGVLQAIKS